MIKIIDFKSRLAAKEEKIETIKNIKVEFEKNINMSMIPVVRDIITNVIPEKLVKIENQFKNPEILELETTRKEALEKISIKREKALNEQKSILNIIAADIGAKKSINKITFDETESGAIAEGEVPNRTAYLAHINASDEYPVSLTSEQHVSMAKRYLLLKEDLKSFIEKIDEINEDFDKSVENIEYVPLDFGLELLELAEITGVSYCKVSEIDPEDYYKFIGDESDFKNYEESLLKISKLAELIKKEYKVRL